MLRPLFTVLSALSLLLFVAAVVLWVRSYWVLDDSRRVPADSPGFYTAFFHGGWQVGWDSGQVPPGGRSWAGQGGGGVSFVRSEDRVRGARGGYAYWHIRISYWLLATVTGILPALLVWDRLRRRHRQKAQGFDVHPEPDGSPPGDRKG